MMVFYKPAIDYLSEHAVDPDKRRYAVNGEAPRHYIDLDHFGQFPWEMVPRRWADAVAKYGEDTLNTYGIVPWWVNTMYQRLVQAFKAKDAARILRLSAEIGHYISDAHVPLHASSNHNGQHSNQHGIHGFWESRIPELFAEARYDFLIGRAQYITRPDLYIWDRVLESGLAADSVLRLEAELNNRFSPDQKYAYEERLGKMVRQYSTAYTTAYEKMLNGMVERRMRQSIYAVASYWYTAWVDAGQPSLKGLNSNPFTPADMAAMDSLNLMWQQGKALGKICD